MDSPDSVVYFIEHGGLVKIGHTTRLRSRIAQLPGRLVGTVSGDRSVEAAYHKQFADFCEYGEWFHCEGDLAAFLLTLPPPDLPGPTRRFQSFTERSGGPVPLEASGPLSVPELTMLRKLHQFYNLRCEPVRAEYLGSKTRAFRLLLGRGFVKITYRYGINGQEVAYAEPVDLDEAREA